MYETDDYLEHYGRLGMKWGQHKYSSYGKKAARKERKAAKLTSKIHETNEEIKSHKAGLKKESARDIKNQARLHGSKNEIRVRKAQIEKGDFGLIFRGSRKRKAEKALDEATKSYKEAVDKDVAIKAAQSKHNAEILAGQDRIKAYTAKRTKALDKAVVYKGKQSIQQRKNENYAAEWAKQQAERAKRKQSKK